jgi:RHS repeat-associated protein
MLMPGRKYSANNNLYRYGFNGKEMDNEVKGDGNQYDYGFRIYDPRLGRFLSVDPSTESYPWYTPYQFAGNKPVMFIDLDGLEEALPKTTFTKPVIRNVSESTCQGCTERAQALAMAKMRADLERLKNEYDDWRSKPENFGKPTPPQYEKVAQNPTPQATFNQGGVLGTKEYKLFKANYDTYGQYLPGPSDIVDGLTALQELSNGNYLSAAAAAFFLIPGADIFKPIKALKGAGGELLEGYLKKFGNQAEHLTKLDIEGALKDIAKTPVVKHGKVWNHLKEVEDAMSGVGNQLEKLTKDINGGKFTDEVLKQAEVIRGTLQKQKDKLTNVLNEAKKNAKQ